MSTVVKAIEGESRCVYCRSKAENITTLFDAWICDEFCENLLIDKYLDLLQKRIDQYEKSIGLKVVE